MNGVFTPPASDTTTVKPLNGTGVLVGGPVQDLGKTATVDLSPVTVGDVNTATLAPTTPVVKTFSFDFSRGGVITVGDADLTKAPVQKNDGTQVLAPTASEDGSFNPDTYEMVYLQHDPSRGLIFDMAAIGQQEGFTLTIQTPPGHVEALKAELQKQVDSGRITPEFRDSITIVTGKANDSSTWTQDNGEVHGGVMVVPPEMDYDKVSGGQGAVTRDRTRDQKIQLAAAVGMPVVESKTYLEGGNVLTGAHADGKAYAIVGQGSLDTSRTLLTETQGRPVTDTEVRQAMADDLGVDVKQLVVTSQPGDFHLDMAMTIVGPNEVILNDSAQAALMELQWMREDHAKAEPASGTPEHATWEKKGVDMEQFVAQKMNVAQSMMKEEDKTRADLEAAGFKVYRMAGKFNDSKMNFMNAVQLTNTQGQRVSVLLGGSPRAEAYVRSQYESLGLAKVHFTDPAFTASTLSLSGGIRCRTKELGGDQTVSQSITPLRTMDTGASDVDPALIQKELDASQKLQPTISDADFR